MSMTIFGVDYEDGRVSSVGIGGILEADNEEPVAAYFRRVVHGRWMKREHDDGYGPYDLYHCSECDAATAHNKMEFCYHCGAIMDTGGSE